MRNSSPDLFSLLAKICVVVGLASLALITLVDCGATRMYAWPWSAFLWAAQLGPLLAVSFRALARNRPFYLPTLRWRVLAGVFGFSVFISALLSPYRASSLLSSVIPLSAVATFFLVHDWIEADRPTRTLRFQRGAGVVSAILVVASLSYLAINLASSRNDSGPFLEFLFAYRNPHPLGHPSYTAGLALLTLPWLYLSAYHSRRKVRFAWGLCTLLALFVLVSTGSRGGLFGLVALVLVGLLLARLGWKKWLALAAIGCGLAIVIAVVNPRTRAMFASGDRKAPPNISNVQRAAMLKAGWEMGRDRPLFGWGVGTTPLAYPQYRHLLDGGVETALQLHDSPIQLWAELGAAGVLSAAGGILLGLLALYHPKKDRPSTTSAGNPSSPEGISLRTTAAATLAGYFVFALTDYQLDVPLFAFGVSVCVALLAQAQNEAAPFPQRASVGVSFLAFFGAVVLLGHSDPAPMLNARALESANDPTKRVSAIQQLTASLALNPDQEIAHFNLGWLLLADDPVSAEKHFLSAIHLVPDKGGVYYGLGLARASQGKGDQASRAFAVEAVNDPRFLTSPEWTAPGMESYRVPTSKQLSVLLERLRARFSADRWPGSEVTYVSALFDWLWRRGSVDAVRSAATNAPRRAYFSTQPSATTFAQAPGKSYRRERIGYPVLMRNLDLPVPVDLYQVNENALASESLSYLFPAKGWLPSPVLLSLLSDSTALE